VNIGPKRNEVKEEWRKLHKEEHKDLYSSPDTFSGDQIEKNKMDRTCSTYGDRRGIYRVFVGET